MSDKIQNVLDGVRTKAGELYVKYGYYLPRRKVVAAAIGGVVATAAKKYASVDIDPALAAIIGAAVFGYFVPENPDVALQVVLQGEDFPEVIEGFDQAPDVPGEWVGPEDEENPPGQIV